MFSSMRLLIAIFAITIAAAVATWAATENYLPRYASAGALVDSVLYESSGKIGLGTTSPLVKLHVTERAQFGQLMVGETWDQTGAEFSMVEDRGTKGLLLTAAGQASNGIAIKEDGKVGVGTYTPSSRLHVNGDITVDGNLAAKYQDVAEWVPSKSKPQVAAVVVIAPDAANVVQESAQPYDTSVAGVVSPKPGIVLGERGKNKVLVAQSGRVRVKVDADFGAIRAGDLLVTSPRPGHAMRSTPLQMGSESYHRPGTILGKALESLAEGQGDILVLLTLQ